MRIIPNKRQVLLYVLSHDQAMDGARMDRVSSIISEDLNPAK